MKFKPLIFITLVITLLSLSCNKDTDNPDNNVDFRQEMRNFVISISQYSRSINPDFLIVPQNGIELISRNGEATGQLHTAYLDAINAHGQEDLFYGYNNDNQSTPSEINSYLRELLDISKNAGKTILVTDYCSTHSRVTTSYLENLNAGYVSFAANERELNNIPSFPDPIHQENIAIVENLTEVKNFLYLINPSDYASKSEFIDAVTTTNYDLLIMDLFFNHGTQFTPDEIVQLRNKANGGKRLILAYMAIGEAEDYRYYWQTSWNTEKPDWIDEENPDWEGNYKVKYWNSEWQEIIYGNNNSYVKKIIDADFDGVYLDIIDAFEYYEN